jgi:predicted O-methyltransferase YrrM
MRRINTMKVIKSKKAQRRLTSMELDQDVLNLASSAAKKAGLSRQKLVEAILRQVLTDPKFVLKV